MKVYIIVEERENRYGNEFTTILGVYGNWVYAVKKFQEIADNPINKTGKDGEVKKTTFHIGDSVRFVEDYYVHHCFECGQQVYRIEERIVE